MDQYNLTMQDVASAISDANVASPAIDSVNYWESRIRTRKRGKRKRGTEDETDITEQGTGACAPSQV